MTLTRKGANKIVKQNIEDFKKGLEMPQTKRKQINLPWYKGYDSSKGEKTIFGHDEERNNGEPILFADKNTKQEHIDYIIKAVNSHDELVEALKLLIPEAEYALECALMSNGESEDTDNMKDNIKLAKQVLLTAQKEG